MAMNDRGNFEELRRAINSAFIESEPDAFSSFEPSFLYNDKERHVKVLNAIREELSDCLSFSLSVAFITSSGYQLLKSAFKTLKERGIHGRILTTDYLAFTDPKALNDIRQNFPNIEIRMFKTGANHEDGFHTKGYIFEKAGGDGRYYKAIIGSSNLTDKALTTNKEWNTSLISTKDGRFIQEVLREYDLLWQKATPLDEYIEQYRLIYEKQKAIDAKKEDFERSPYVLTPNSMQIEFVNNLLSSIHRGDKRGLLISATGTGKTFASAFALRELNPKKVLFLAHRHLLLSQALSSYKRVLPVKKSLTIYNGGNIIEASSSDYLFATCSLIGREEHIRKFARDAFDVIVIDEVHRAASATYQRILEYFSPSYVLGMSATPERSDDQNAIFSLFDHNVLYEIRLKDALELDLLCPFHYYGITDLKGINDETYENADFLKLYSEERIAYIIKEASFYGYSGERLRGLIFVSRNEEADILSKKLNERGYKTIALSGEDDLAKREKAIALLEKEDISDNEYLDYIISVDILNEGVDIPSVNQVLLLRPTESSIIFIQQLGRGLRKRENKDFVVVIDFIGNYDNNFMIPKAFSYNGDKEAARNIVINGGDLPGISTIEFDEIAKEKIFRSISKASFNNKEELRRAVISLANKLNRLPAYSDFLDYSDFEPERIILKYGSYFAFLKAIERNLPSFISLPCFNDFEMAALMAIGKGLGMGIRLDEPFILKRLIEGKKIAEIEDELFYSYKRIIDAKKRACIEKILQGKWDYGLPFAFCDEKMELTSSFKKALENDIPFKKEVIALLEYILSRNERFYSLPYDGLDLSLYGQYSYRDVCQALNYGNNLTAVIGGYKYDKDTNTFPIFINYDKDPSLESSTNYADKFLNPRLLSWESKKNRRLNSNELVPLLKSEERNTAIYLFIRKANNDKDIDAKKFYFLGKMNPYGEAREVRKEVLENGETKRLSYVDIDFLLDKEVRKDIYDYLTANIKEGEEHEND